MSSSIALKGALCDSRIIDSLFQEERTVIIDMAISSNLIACIPISLVPIVLSWIYPALNLPESHFGTIRKHWILDHLAPTPKLQKLGEKSWSSYPHPHVFLWKFSPQISWNILEKYGKKWYLIWCNTILEGHPQKFYEPESSQSNTFETTNQVVNKSWNSGDVLGEIVKIHSVYQRKNGCLVSSIQWCCLLAHSSFLLFKLPICLLQSRCLFPN